MTKTGKPFIVISLFCLLIFLFVQYTLIYNTFELREKQYNRSEKGIIKEYYNNSIRNDKLFPGGQKIIDGFIIPNFRFLEQCYKHNRKLFDIRSQLICDSIFRELRGENNLDSLFSDIIKTNELNPDLAYRLYIDDLSITFDGNNYVTLYSKQYTYPHITTSVQSRHGIEIGGTLENIDEQSLTSSLSISSAQAYSYRIEFTLYTDINNRTFAILKAMTSTFLLSVFSIIFVTGVYYFIYRNWMKQKKLAEMKSDFLNSITHEFNTPLSAILIATKSLKNNEISSRRENILGLADVIDRQSTRLQYLINQALDITSMPRKDIEKEAFLLNSFLTTIINDYRMKIGANADIYLRQSPRDARIRANKFFFTTMIYNILDNAIKYNTSLIKRIWVETHFEHNEAIIIIKDNGVGISPGITKHIFDKFYRKESTEVSGLGLGLFYVKQVIESHEWRLHLQSEEKKGTEFHIFIPLKP